MLDFVLRYFPRQFDFVTSQLEAMQEARVQLGVAGSILMVWAAMGVFGAITSAVNHAWGVEKQPSYFKHKMISFVMLVMASLLLMAALALVSAINVVEASWFAAVVERYETLREFQSFAVEWASTFAFIFVVGLVFYFVPNAKVRFRDVWVGAVVTGLAWRGALAASVVRDLTRFDRPWIDCRGRRVPDLGLHVGGDLPVRRRGHRRQRPPAASPAGGDPGRAESANLMPWTARDSG